MQINPAAIKNILVVRNDRFGEFLLNIPAFRALKERFPSARIILMVHPHVHEIALHTPYIDEVLVWQLNKHPFLEKGIFVNTLRSKHIDMAIILNPSGELHLMTFLAGIPLRVGYDRKWGFLLNTKIEDQKASQDTHEIENNLQLVSLVGARTQDTSLILRVDEASLDSLNCDVKRAVVVHPWTSDALKQWPLERFKELTRRLESDFSQKVVIIGGRDEVEKGSDKFNSLGKGVINLTGRTTLVQLAALLKSSRLLISGDSGPVHLACAVGASVIALFRNDIPGKTARRWGPRGKGSIVIERPSLKDISVNDVLVKVKEALSQ